MAHVVSLSSLWKDSEPARLSVCNGEILTSIVNCCTSADPPGTARCRPLRAKASETVLPIPNALATILREYREHWKPNPEGFLFVTRNGRPPSSNNVVEHHLWIILDALGFPRCGLHAFRHSHTALLLRFRSHAQSRAAATSSRRCAYHPEIYGHVVGDAHREAVEKVASKLRIGRYWTPTHYCQLVESVA